MSQYDFGDLESPLSGTTFFNTHLEPWRLALHSMHKGPSRPGYVQTGMIWVQDGVTPWNLYMFDGTDDILLGTVNATTNIFTPAGVTVTSFYASTTAGTANAQTATTGCTALVAGQIFYVKHNAANTSSTMTLNFDTLGAQNCKKNSWANKVLVAVNDITAGFNAIWLWDGTDMVLLNPPASAKGTTITAASTTDLTTMNGEYANLSGNTNISTISMNNGQAARLYYTSTSLVITLGASLTYLGAAAGTLTLRTGDYIELRRDGTVTRIVAYVPGGANTSPAIPGGRLTLTTGVPVTTTDVIGASTLYYAPCTGNKIDLFNGTSWVTFVFPQISLALSGLTSGRLYDVFAYDNAGTVALETLIWTNDTTRATTLTRQDGVLVKTGDATRRYLGTFYSTGTTTTEDSQAKRYLWNYYNAVRRPMKFLELTSSWNYSTATWRQMRATAANKFEFIIGVAGDQVFAQIPNFMVFNSTATYRSAGVAWGLDSTSTPSADAIYHEGRANSTAPAQVSAIYRGAPAEGRHTLNALEKGDGNDTQTWSPNNSGGVWQANFGANGELNA